jgi:hypothetical protein
LVDDVDGRDIEGAETEAQELKDLIDHWVQAIDHWVQRIDEGMGGTAGSVDPAAAPDAAPDEG